MELDKVVLGKKDFHELMNFLKKSEIRVNKKFVEESLSLDKIEGDFSSLEHSSFQYAGDLFYSKDESSEHRIALRQTIFSGIKEGREKEFFIEFCYEEGDIEAKMLFVRAVALCFKIKEVIE